MMQNQAQRAERADGWHLSAKGGEVVFQCYVWQPLTVPIKSGRKWMA